MIGTSFPELIFIRTAIFLLRSITPLSILFTSSLPFLFLPTPIASRLLITFTNSVPLQLLAAYTTSETLFFFLIYIPRKYSLQAAAEHPPLSSRKERKELIRRIVENVPDERRYLSTWFLGAQVADGSESDNKGIKRENVKEFMRWSVFNSSGDEGGVVEGEDGKVVNTKDEEREEELDEYVTVIEEGFAQGRLQDGRGDAECLRLTLDEVRMKHRPLTWYFIIGCLDTLTHARLSLLGYECHREPFLSIFTSFPFRLDTLLSSHITPHPRIPYWHRPHRSTTKLPLLYFHGIGIGLHPYIDTFIDLAKLEPDVGVIILELLPVNSRISKPQLNREEMLDGIRQILDKCGWEKFVLGANSYGTVIAAQMLHDNGDNGNGLRSRIEGLVLIDPVCMLLHLPDVAYNFLRRVPHRANEHMLHYFASTDPMTAHTLSRRFFWSQNILWKEDISNINVTVFLGGRDLIVDTYSVRRYLTDTLNTKSRRRERKAAYTHLREEESNNKAQSEVGDEDELEDVKFDYGTEDGKPGLGGGGEWVKKNGEKGEEMRVFWFADLDHAQVFGFRSPRERLVRAVSDMVSGKRKL